MPKYNVFEELVDESVKEEHKLLEAQCQALFNASDLLNDAMLESSLSQKELAQKLGISKGYMSRLLSGTENISLKNFAKWMHLLGYGINIVSEKNIDDSNVHWVDFHRGAEYSFKEISEDKLCSELKDWSSVKIPIIEAI